MNTTAKSIAGLRRLIKRLVADEVLDVKVFREWKKVPRNEKFIERALGYKRLEGMPSVRNLVQPFFHPTLPLIGLNYTNTAHITLHQFDSGWAPGLRLCRGIVFDHWGKLVAFPFDKFFNYGEHPETRNLPDESFVATVKQDGHLGIVFEYNGELHITTRGSFVSPTHAFASEMLKQHEARWKKVLSNNVNPLVEIIHPNTHVHVDYAGWTGFILIGARNRYTYEDYGYDRLREFAADMGIQATPRWEGNSIEDLKALMRDLSVHNQEGFVVRFASGLRVKFKFANYLELMIGAKLDHKYVMRRLMEGSLTKRLHDLPGEIQVRADALRDELVEAATADGDKKVCFERLYALVPEDDRTDTYKALCRSFYRWNLKQSSSEEAA